MGVDRVTEKTTEKTTEKEYRHELRRLHGEPVALQEWVRRSGGKVCVVFDRSWYDRAGVERVLGYATQDQVREFLRVVPAVEQAMVDSGIILLKYWLEVGPDKQTRRLQSRIDDPRKVWKLSDLDLRSYTRWHDYSRARNDMFLATDTAWAPWSVVDSDDKKRARLNVLTHLLASVPYEPLPKRRTSLPKRKAGPDPVAPGVPLHWIPTPF
jgi:polyphosphate kinase